MFLSISIIIFLSLILAQIFNKLKLPSLIGFLIAGILLGPFVFNLIDHSILDLSSELRQIALIIILIRAGLSLDLDDLKKVGRPAILLSFVPAIFEIIAITIFAPIFFNLSIIEALILASIVAAVSPAVIVPRMIKLMSNNQNNDKKIPQMILAGASIDDVFVIILFTSFVHTYQSGESSITSILLLPLSIVFGILIGFIMGYILALYFKRFHIRDTIKVLILFAFGFLFIAIEQYLSSYLFVSSLIMVITLGITLLYKHEVLAKRLVNKFEKIWVIAEIMLFVLVGAAININVLPSIGLLSVLLIFIGLIFRSFGVLFSIYKTGLNNKEKLFTVFSYTPKATVQAAIGAIPLSLGIPSGEIILAIAVLAIIITAPIGAILIDNTSDKLLN
jgi:solute carrier family 9B (sodium/hydrogen exchanger), member 1/2